MMKILSQYQNLVIIILLTFLGFFFGLFGTWIFWAGLTQFDVRVDYWAMVEALATAFAAAAVLGGGFVAIRELDDQGVTRQMEVADRLYEELNSKENVAARRWIFQKLPDDPSDGIDTLSEEGRDAVKQVLNSMDRVAFLTQSNWIPEEKIMPWMNPMIVKSWIKLLPYVDFEAKRRNESDYYEAVRVLAERCIAWRKKNLPNTEITWVKNAL
jgi:hypothetical protein